MENLELESDAPELSTSAQWWKFWISFAVRPLIFVLLNGIAAVQVMDFLSSGTLNEQDLIRLYGTNHTRSDAVYTDIEYSPLERFRYNELILSVWLLLNALVLLFAMHALKKGIDEIGSMPNPVDMSTNLHVYAQVSREVDVAMGRGSRPRESIFVSLLVLATVMCAAIGFASLAVWCFSWTNKADTSCRLNQVMDVVQLSSQSSLHGVPSDQ
jgi:hypothetical protein